jgi:hypothetical protein
VDDGAGVDVSEGQKPWWANVEEPVEALARKMASRSGHDVDLMMLPYCPMCVETTGGNAYIVPDEDRRPLWTYYTATARWALEVFVEGTQVPTNPDIPATGVAETEEDYTPAPASGQRAFTPEERWRHERGLDDSQSP